MANMRSVEGADVEHKRVLLRLNLDVPRDSQGRIGDKTKIKAVCPTLNYLIEHQARIIIIAHWDRPHGKVADDWRLDPIARELEKFIDKPVNQLDETVGPKAREVVRKMQDGDIVMLENVRFNAGEKGNDPKFAKELAALGEIFVSDDFATAHRRSASISSLPRLLPAYAGFLLQKEVDTLSAAIARPKRPLLTLMGGAKVETKIGLMGRLLDRIDVLLLGGALVANFYRQLGYNIGRSLYEPDMLDLVDDLMNKAEKSRMELWLPSDVVVARSITAKKPERVVDLKKGGLTDQEMILDIGPQTVENYKKKIAEAGTVIWNGPVGAFEYNGFGAATKELATAIAKGTATSITGGGDTLAALDKYRLSGEFNHVSTGGGAMLEFLEGKRLPGVVPYLKK